MARRRCACACGLAFRRIGGGRLCRNLRYQSLLADLRAYQRILDRRDWLVLQRAGGCAYSAQTLGRQTGRQVGPFSSRVSGHDLPGALPPFLADRDGHHRPVGSCGGYGRGPSSYLPGNSCADRRAGAGRPSRGRHGLGRFAQERRQGGRALLGGLLIAGLGYGGMLWMVAGILLAAALALFVRFHTVDFSLLPRTQKVKS